MKQLISKVMMLVMAASVLSFVKKPGGEGFEIFLNDHLLVQKLGTNVSTAGSIDLSSAVATDQLVVKYYHCGQVGKNRIITIKDEQDRILKEFHYTDQTKAVMAISVPVKDLLLLKKSYSTLRLYYSSTQLPKGRILASIFTRTKVS
jgi:hypothetical protein